MQRWISWSLWLCTLWGSSACSSSQSDQSSLGVYDYYFASVQDLFLLDEATESPWKFYWYESTNSQGTFLQGALVGEWGELISETEASLGQGRRFSIVVKDVEGLGPSRINYIEIILPVVDLQEGDVQVTIRAENNDGVVYTQTFWASVQMN